MSTLLQIKNLKKFYPIRRGLWSKTVGHIQALHNIDLEINKGEILGVVGESGCGKSTLGKLILKLIDPTDGEIIYDGKDLLKTSNKEFRPMRQKLQIVFQNPYSSLNPRMKIHDIIAEPLKVHNMCNSNSALEDRINELLDLVGLKDVSRDKYPHELSGGQRQRIAIARALSLNPEFIVLDEPVSALDVSVQAQILNLLLELQKKLNLTYLFISHDLSVVSYFSNKVAVMYLGSIVETGDKDDIIKSPKHPYTKALLSAAPQIRIDSENEKERIILQGDLPDPSNLPSGCAFRTRCPIVQDKCAIDEPKLEKHGNQIAACHFIDS